MTAYAPAQTLAYQNTAVHGSVAAADPHGLVLLLMNGALERIARARGCIQNRALAEKSQLLHRAVSIVDELRNSLNLKEGGELAANMDKLYDYMSRQLLKAQLENNVAVLDEVSGLLNGIRDAWEKIPKPIRKTGPR